MNSVTLVGRLTKDPELKFSKGNGSAVTTFTIAVNRRFKKEGQPEADFIQVVCFGKTAEATANYMTKGKLISLAGYIQTRNYEAKDGTRKYVTEVIANEINFLESGKKEYEPSDEERNSRGSEFTSNPDIRPIDDGDIPF
ncbi:single-stranded DNA-binding protein [Clostridium estertheticum]|uniref:single-stranded DNA-binding protein n=1 Tax=Clostridium estertheticum TaxID=238834 RepID=UPI0013EEBF63|nr:single-stranded DNA-binding protein [Clostridium estertheticum]MBZ9608660.1 single-stranded DNA-binding protein [Clostridium estertheticum]